MRVMRIIRRAAVLSLLMSWSGVAGAQQGLGVFTYLQKDRDTPYGKASQELDDMATQRLKAAEAGNCARKSYFENSLGRLIRIRTIRSGYDILSIPKTPDG